MVMLSTTDTIIIVEVWTIDDVVVAAMAPKASTVSVVKIVEEIVEAKSVKVLWAIKENTLDAITKVVDSIVEAIEVVNPQTVKAIIVLHD